MNIENLSFFKELYHSSFLGIYIYQEDGKIVFANNAFSKLTGYAIDELIGRSFFEFLEDSVKNSVEKNVERRLNNQHFQFEYADYIYKVKDGLRKPVKIFAYTIEYKNKPSGIVFVIDNTEAKSYEKLFNAIRKTNNSVSIASNENLLLKSICDVLVEDVGYISASIGSIDKKTELYNMQFINSKLPQLIQGMKETKISVNPKLPYGRGSVHKAYTTGKIALISDVLSNENMKPWWSYYKQYNIYSACSIPIFKNNNIEYILLIHDDIPNSFTEKNIELLEEIQTILSFALDKLEKDKNLILLKEALDKSHECVIITDTYGKIIHANSAVYKVSGFKPSEIIGKKFTIFKSRHENDIKYKNIIKQLYNRETYRGRFENIDKNGNAFYLDSIIIPITIDSKLSYFVALSRDITTMIEKEKQITFQSQIYNTLYNLNKLYISSKTKKEFLEKLPCIFTKNMEIDAAFILELSSNDLRIMEKSTKTEPYETFINNLENILNKVNNLPFFKHLPFYKAIKNKKIYIVNDIRKKYYGIINNFIKHHRISAGCAIPIEIKDNYSLVLILTSSIKNIFNREIYNLLNIVYKNIAFMINKFEQDRFSKMVLSTLDAGYNFVIILDRYCNIAWINKTAEDFLGFKQDKLINKNISILFNKNSDNKLVNLIKDAEQNKKPIHNILDYNQHSIQIMIMPFIVDGKIEHYVITGKDISKESKLKEEIDKLLRYDKLTNLPNKNQFVESISAFLKRMSAAKNTIGCLSIINPIGFVQINRAFGFDNGNKILIEISKRLKNSLRAYDVVSKLESDRFGVLLKELKNEEDALIIMKKAVEALTKPYILDNQTINISFNIGISLIPKDGMKPMVLINKAQIALADAKTKGENTFGFFRKDVEIQAFEKLKLRNNLTKAIENREFILYYQPYFDKNLSIVGAEALIRWCSNDKIIYPSYFIEYLEETYMITQVDNIVISIALKELNYLRKKHLEIPISINIAPQSFKKSNFNNKLIEAVDRFNVKPELINIEIIERSFLDNTELVKKRFNDLKEYGFSISIDDFGTGYSSLSYLSQIKADYIKIDISFVKKIEYDKDTKSIIEAIIYLAHKLNMKTIAEGVETKNQFEILKKLNCDYFQGYLFSKPIKRDDFEQLLENNHKNNGQKEFLGYY